MRNLKTLIVTSLLGLLFVGNVYASDDISIRISKPKTPTNLNSFDLSVVTLDFQNRALTVKCYKKTPSDAGFSQFGSDIALSAGGDSTICPVTSSIIGDQGTYQFYATAHAGAETVTSETVSVEYKTGGPDTPNYNGKERVNICDYKIKFHTADDGGKTVKVEIYRSENTSFDVNDGSRVDTIGIGSNTDGSSTTTPPSCDKEYYFAIRAFDTNGNGSGVAGDSVTKTTTTNPTTVTQGTSGSTGGAIAAGTAGNILGAGAGGSGTGSGSVLGEEATPSATEEVFPSKTKSFWSTKNIIIVIAGIAFIALAIRLRKKETSL